MKKYLAYLFLSFFLMPAAKAQFPKVDTLFSASELIYFSELERESLNNYLAGRPDYLAMIASVNPSTEKRELDLYRDWVNEIIAEIQRKKFDQLDEVKKIERIEKNVSKALLLNYRHNADFDALFSAGDYNYFTAAAIYAFVLDQLEIPYEIYELPTHINLLAYPESHKIVFEATQPGQQFFMFDHETRKNFVDFIYDQGVIDERTYRNNNIRDLFQQYYFSSTGLSIREMIGMLYINSAVSLLMSNNTAESYSQLEKAFILFPGYKTQYLLLVQLNQYLLEMDYHNPLDLGYLLKASRLIGYGIKFDLVDGFLLNIVQKVYIEEEDPDGFMYIYEYLQKYLTIQELKDNFSFYYYYEAGRLEFNATRYTKALEYLEAAYLLRPDDERTQDLLTRALGGYSLMLSPSLVLDKLEYYDSSFSEITTEGVYLMVKGQTYLSMFGEAYQLKDGKNGERYMKLFEELMDSQPELEVDHILIGRSYSSAAIYYYGEGKIFRSKSVVEKGLSYAPDNIELKLKLKSLE